MALVEVNGVPVLSGSISLPRVGAWVADLALERDVTGAVVVSIADGTLELHGTVATGAAYVDTGYVRIVGGAGGLGKTARAREYLRTRARIVLGDLMTTSGESLSPTVAASILDARKEHWAVTAGETAVQLGRLVSSLSGAPAWRILPDGTVWIGAETWPASALTDYQIVTERPGTGTLVIGCEAPLLLPGTTLDGRRVDAVDYDFSGPGVRATVWISPETATRDRASEAMRTLVRRAVPEIDTLSLYRAKVVKQSANLATVDVMPEDTRLPGMSEVPIRYGIPGVKAQLASGAMVSIGWDGGDPSKPYATIYDSGANGATIVIEAGTTATVKATKVVVDGVTELGGTGTAGNPLYRVVLGMCNCPFAGAPHSALGGCSTKVTAKQV